MKEYGKVSIIMPTWNCAQYISTSIKSVMAQTYTNWEILIQDDCSTDGTVKILRSYMDNDSRIKYACNPKNSGAAVSRNNALKRADGRWIAFLDSDDLWESTKLERQITFMLENGYYFSYTGYQEIEESGRDTGTIISGPTHVSKFLLNAFCWPGCLTVMYDRELVGLIQIEDIKKNNDYAMWLKVIKKTDCFLLDECLAKYRRGRIGSISTHGYTTMIKWHYKLWREAEEKCIINSSFWTFINLCFGVFKKIFYAKKYK